MKNPIMLIVDDVELNRQILRISFENEYEILEAADGVEALQLLQEQDADIVVTDIFMEPMDGYTLISRIREIPHYEKLPIIAITESDAASKQKAIAAGADEFVTKPFVTEELHMRIRNACGMYRFDHIDFNNILQSISGGIAVYKLTGKGWSLQYCSDGVATLLGYTIAEYRNRVAADPQSTIYQADRPSVNAAFEHAQKTLEDMDVVYRVVCHDGNLVWVHLRGHVTKSAKGDTILNAVFLNVSKDTELYRNILNETNQIVQVSDLHTHEILYANNAACVFAGRENGIYAGETCYSFLMGNDRVCQFCHCDQLTGGQLSSYEKEYRGRYYKVSGKRIRWNGRDAFVEYVEDITEYQQRQAHMEAENKSLNAVIRDIQGGIFVFRAEKEVLTLIAANPMTEQMFGISLQKTIGLRQEAIFQLVHPEDVERVKDAADRLIHTSEPVDYTYRSKNKRTGEYVWLHGNGIGTVQGDGSQLIYVLLTDLSVQKKLEQELQASVREAHELIDNAPGGIVKFAQRQTQYIGAGLPAMLGYERQEFEEYYKDRLVPNPLIHPDDAARMQQAKSTVLQKRCNLNEDCRMRCKDGHYLWVNVQSYLLKDTLDGDIWYTSYSDISGLKKTQEKLRESEESLRAAVQHANVDYWEYDMVHDTAYAASASMQVTNLDLHVENFPESIFKAGFIHREDVEKYRQMIQKLKSGVHCIEFECRVKPENHAGYEWKRVRYTTIFDTAGHPLKAVATAQSVVDLKKMEQNFVQTMNQNGIWALELDLATHQLHQLGDLTTRHEMGELEGWQPDAVIDAGLYHESSIPEVRRVYREICAGAKRAIARVLRYSSLKQDFIWRELIITVLEGEKGNSQKAICSSRDISGEIHLEQLYNDEQLFRNNLSTTLLSNSQINLTKNIVETFHFGEEDVFNPEIAALVDYRERISRFFTDIELSDEDNAALSPEQLLAAYHRGETKVNRTFMAKVASDGHLVHVGVKCHIVRRPTTDDIIAFFYSNDDSEEYTIQQITNSIIFEGYDYAGLIRADSGSMRVLARQSDGTVSLLKYPIDYNAIAVEDSKNFVNPDVENSEAKPLLLSSVIEHLSAESVYTVEYGLRNEHGEIRRKKYTFTYSDQKHSLIFFSCTDIEDLFQMERKRQKQLELAADAAKEANAAKTEFLARMSHEIRTPLNGVIGLTKLAMEETDRTVVNTYLSKIDTSGKHLTRLISDILDMSKIESGEVVLHPEVYHFREFENEITVLQPLLDQKRIHLIQDVSEFHVPIVVDRTRFTQIVFNLLSNAVKFTPENGSIHLVYRNQLEGNWLNMDLDVRDNGIGMSPEFQQIMFEPFAQESSKVISATQGTGLGLGIAKAYTDLMGGTLTAESELGKGTTFHLHLKVPVANPSGVDGVDTDAELDFSGKTILVVEDHPVNQMIVVKLLEKKGAKTLTAKNGQEALHLFESGVKHSVDAILMDIRMPVMDGLEATRAIRASKHPDATTVPILAMTANAFDQDVQSSKRAGMNAHLAKPIDPQRLYLELNTYLHKSN